LADGLRFGIAGHASAPVPAGHQEVVLLGKASLLCITIDVVANPFDDWDELLQELQRV